METPEQHVHFYGDVTRQDKRIKCISGMGWPAHKEGRHEGALCVVKIT
jgi:hypothetical protein